MTTGPARSDQDGSRPTDAPRRSVRRTVLVGLSWLVGLSIVGFVAGFLLFVAHVVLMEPAGDPRADGIVALTGGRDRVAEAIDLLAEGRGRRLLISGVHPQTRAIDIQKSTEADREMFACCVDLGRTALTTLGNAAEAADWAKGHGFTSLIVVTSAYHMPRSMLELDRALPGVRKIPHPISRPDLNLDTWYLHGATARLLFVEYLKYIGARVGHGPGQVRAGVDARTGGGA